MEGYLRHLRQRRRLHEARLIQHLHKTCLLHRIGLLLPILPLLYLPVLYYTEETAPTAILLILGAFYFAPLHISHFHDTLLVPNEDLELSLNSCDLRANKLTLLLSSL